VANQDQPGWSRALVRFTAVSHVEAYVLGGQTLAAAISRVCQLESSGCGDVQSKRFGRSSVYNWYRAYKVGGMDALFDEPRERRGSSLPLPFLNYLCSEKQKDPEASIPEVISRAREKSIITMKEPIDRTTVFRAARALDLPMLRRKKAEATTMRPFAYEHRMMMVLCDGKHFRAGTQGLKRVALFFIDDATRYVLDAFVGFSEDTDFFLSSIFRVIQNFGYMGALYLDHGPGFIANDSKNIMAQLKIPFIHGQAGYPEGRGKVERFNGTVTQDVLRGLNKPGIDPSRSALELRLRHYIRERYNIRHHSNVDAAPAALFENDSKPLHFPVSEEDLRRSFILSEPRKVRQDNVIHWYGLLYETPIGYAGRTVTIYRNVISHKIWLLHNGEATVLLPPDLSMNARGTRAKESLRQHPPREPIVTAAEMHFNRDFSPIIDVDGGFSNNTDTQEPQPQ
jgi:putative transposase